jgi:hypothetical protein
MDASTVLARLIGPYLVIVGIGLFVNLGRYPKIIEDFFANAALVYLGSAVSLIVGLAVVVFHNVWVWDWPVIITLFGWLALIKGTLLIVWPALPARHAAFFARKPTRIVIPWAIMIAIGVFLTIKGVF